MTLAVPPKLFLTEPIGSVKPHVADYQKFIFVLGKAPSVPLPDEIAKELEVLSGFSNVTSQPNYDENQGFQLPPAPTDTNFNQSKSQSRIGKFKNKCTPFRKIV